MSLSRAERILLGLLAFFLPPVPVFLLTKTIFTKEFLVSVILTCLGHVPGVLFTLYYIYFEYPRDSYNRLDNESRPGHRQGRNVAASGGGYTDNPEPESQNQVQAPIEAPQVQPEFDQVPAPVEGSSDAPPPSYDDTVPKEQQLKQGEIDSKADNKIQR